MLPPSRICLPHLSLLSFSLVVLIWHWVSPGLVLGSGLDQMDPEILPALSSSISTLCGVFWKRFDRSRYPIGMMKLRVLIMSVFIFRPWKMLS